MELKKIYFPCRNSTSFDTNPTTIKKNQESAYKVRVSGFRGNGNCCCNTFEKVTQKCSAERLKMSFLCSFQGWQVP